jgi:hypothetical protein
MSNDRVVRGLLWVIATALVHLSVVLTPWPTARAQSAATFGAQRPGEPTAPAQVVIVGWRVHDVPALPVQVVGRIAGDVRVTSAVETRQAPGTFTRVVLAGWEPNGPPKAGTYTRWDAGARGLPVNVVASVRP